MSEEIVGSCIKHNDIRHLRVYHDYMLLYHCNEHKAKIIRILEAWTNTKRAAWYKAAYDNKEQGKPAPVPDFWITMSHQQFSEYMYGTSKPDTIKKNLKELIEKEKHVERRINPDEPYGSPQYRLNTQLIQKGLDELDPVPFLPEIPDVENPSPSEKHTPPGKTTPGRGVKDTPTQGGKIPLPQGGKTATSYNSNKNTSKNKDKDTDQNFANANSDDASPPLSSENETQSPYPQSNEQLSSEDVDNTLQSDIETSLPEVPGETPTETTTPTADETASIPATSPESPLNAKTETPTGKASEQKSPIANDTRTRPTYTKRSGKILIDEWYALFEELYRQLPGYAPNFKIPQDANSTSAILSMINAGATREQAAYVFKDICNEKDPFWHTKRTITCVKSQFATRVSRMNVKQHGKNVSIQQQLQDKVPDFKVKEQWELLDMMPDARKAYSQQLTAHLKAQREREERVQQVEHPMRQVSA